MDKGKEKEVSKSLESSNKSKRKNTKLTEKTDYNVAVKFPRSSSTSTSTSSLSLFDLQFREVIRKLEMDKGKEKEVSNKSLESSNKSKRKNTKLNDQVIKVFKKRTQGKENSFSVMGSKPAREVLVRQILPSEFSKRKQLESFWLLEPPKDELNEEEEEPIISSSTSSPMKKPVVGGGFDSGSVKGISSLSSALNRDELMRWGVHRRVTFIGKHKEMKNSNPKPAAVDGQFSLLDPVIKLEDEKEAIVEGILEQETNETRMITRKRTPEILLHSRKKAKTTNELKGCDGVQSKEKLSYDWWSKVRYKTAEGRMLDILKKTKAVFGSPVIRKDLRLEARNHIGDTGLLDHQLKHMAGKVAPNGVDRFRRLHNSEGEMEYRLESADLVNARKEAGVNDPYWTPPWKLGDNPSQHPICAKEPMLLKDEMAEIKSSMGCNSKEVSKSLESSNNSKKTSDREKEQMDKGKEVSKSLESSNKSKRKNSSEDQFNFKRPRSTEKCIIPYLRLHPYPNRNPFGSYFIFSVTWIPSLRLLYNEPMWDFVRNLQFSPHGLWPHGTNVWDGLAINEDLHWIGDLAEQTDLFWPNGKFKVDPNLSVRDHNKRLWRPQWQEHGTRSGLDPNEYMLLIVDISRIICPLLQNALADTSYFNYITRRREVRVEDFLNQLEVLNRNIYRPIVRVQPPLANHIYEVQFFLRSSPPYRSMPRPPERHSNCPEVIIIPM